MKYYSIAFVLLLSNCTYLSVEELTVDCSQNPIIVNSSIVNADCGVDNGSIKIEATGGKAPFDYQLGEARQVDPLFSNLVAGVYQIITTDANGCTTETEATVLNKEGVQATATATEAGCNDFQGKITIAATLGQTPYTYSLNDGDTQTSNVFSGLGHGVFAVKVIDDFGCEFTFEEMLLSGVSFKDTVEPIMMNSCAVTGCHNGSQFPDLRTYNGVNGSSKLVKEFTQSGFMPISGTLTQAQKDAIACWVDDGALNN